MAVDRHTRNTTRNTSFGIAGNLRYEHEAEQDSEYGARIWPLAERCEPQDCAQEGCKKMGVIHERRVRDLKHFERAKRDGREVRGHEHGTEEQQRRQKNRG